MLQSLELGDTETICAEVIGQLYRYIDKTKSKAKHEAGRKAVQQIETKLREDCEGQAVLKRLRTKLRESASPNFTEQEERVYAELIDAAAHASPAGVDELPLELNSFDDTAAFGMAADMVHTLIMRAPDPQSEEWRGSGDFGSPPLLQLQPPLPRWSSVTH